MTDLTEDGRRTLAEIASRHGLSEGAVEHMARAVARGGGTMAQFNLPELGGSGQWMAGGMTMVGDMFNHGLVARVDALCAELSHAMANQTLFRAVRAPGMAMGQSGGAWWPDGLGQPSSTGGQGATRYAYFPQARRVAVDAGDGRGVVLLDAGDHRIGGFSQQQQGTGGDPLSGVSFSSQHGQFSLASLPRVGTGSRTSEPAAATPAAATETTTASGARTAPEAPAAPAPRAEPAPAPRSSEPAPASPAPLAPEAARSPEPASAPSTSPAGGRGPMDADAILSTIERLAKLREAGALTDEEFAAKKADLLGRL